MTNRGTQLVVITGQDIFRKEAGGVDKGRHRRTFVPCTLQIVYTEKLPVPQ